MRDSLPDAARGAARRAHPHLRGFLLAIATLAAFAIAATAASQAAQPATAPSAALTPRTSEAARAAHTAAASGRFTNPIAYSMRPGPKHAAPGKLCLVGLPRCLVLGERPHLCAASADCSSPGAFISIVK
jgi:hypothetical protein